MKKDWKERLGIIAVALILILAYAAVYLLYNDSYEMTSLLTTVMALAFLPFLGVTLGAGAFQSELKDGAWAYLFSRPVPRWKIWAVKLGSQLLLLILLGGLFFAVGSLLPDFYQMRFDFSLPAMFQTEITLFVAGIALALNLFAISFALSFFNDNPLVPVFFSLLMLPALGYAAGGVLVLLWLIFPYLVSPAGLEIFLPLAVLGASLLAFGRADFTRRGRMTRAFFLRLAPLFLVALVLGLAAKAGLGILMIQKPRIYQLFLSSGAAYFHTETNLYRYDPSNGKAKRFGGQRLSYPRPFPGEGKLAFTSYRNKRGEGQDLWIAAPDGSETAKIFSTNTDVKEGTTEYISSFVSSPDGDRLAWLVRRYERDHKSTSVFIFQSRADGEDLRSRPLNIPDRSMASLAGWTDGTGDIILFLYAEGGSRIAAFDWDREELRYLTENVKHLHLYTPEGRAEGATFVRKEENGLPSLVLMTFAGLEEEILLTADWVSGANLTWDSRGRRCLLSSVSGSGVLSAHLYDRSGGSVEKVDIRASRSNFTWVLGGSTLIYQADEGRHLVLRDMDSGDEKKLQIPRTLQRAFSIHSLDKKALLLTYEGFDLWLADLITGKWRRIH